MGLKKMWKKLTNQRKKYLKRVWRKQKKKEEKLKIKKRFKTININKNTNTSELL